MSNPIDAPRVRDVLILFELRKLGDTILSLPFVRGAKFRYDVYVICHPAAAPLFATQLPEDHILKLVPPWVELNAGSIMAFMKTVRQARTRRPRVAVCGWADARVEWMMRLIGAPRRVGFPMTTRNYYACRVPWRRRHLRHGRWLSRLGHFLTGRPLLTDPLFRLDDRQSHLLDWEQVGESLGVVPDTTLPWITANKAPLDPSMEAELMRFRASGTPVWIVHPGAGSTVKRWGNANFDKVIHSFFIPNNIPCVAIQPPDDPVMSVAGTAVVTYRPPNLESLIAVTSMANAVLCNDSAMSHLAAAMGKRVVAIFGPSDPKLFAPYRCENDVVDKANCVCRPCMDRCLMPSPVCMQTIQVPDVASTVQRVHQELLSGMQSIQGSPHLLGKQLI